MESDVSRQSARRQVTVTRGTEGAGVRVGLMVTELVAVALRSTNQCRAGLLR
jgi:hypothetical protein